MRRWIAVGMLLWAVIWVGAGVWGQASNPFSPLARMNQGPDPTGNSGYPMAVVPATGSLAFPATLSPNFFLQDTLANPASAVPHVGSFGMIWDPGAAKWNRATSTMTSNQGTNPWIVGFGGVRQPVSPLNSSSIGTPFPDAPAIYVSGQTQMVGNIPLLFDNDNGGYHEAIGCRVFIRPTGSWYSQMTNGGHLDQGSLIYPDINAPSMADPPNSTVSGCLPSSQNYVWTGGANAYLGYERVRTPKKFLNVATAAAGNTALWTPTAGFKFRLMRWRYTITDNATLAAPGVLTVTLNDAGGAIGQADDVFVPAIALLNNGQLAVSPWIDLGNGILSGAVNNVLNINLSAALVTGTVRVQVCGTEE